MRSSIKIVIMHTTYLCHQKKAKLLCGIIIKWPPSHNNQRVSFKASLYSNCFALTVSKFPQISEDSLGSYKNHFHKNVNYERHKVWWHKSYVIGVASSFPMLKSKSSILLFLHCFSKKNNFAAFGDCMIQPHYGTIILWHGREGNRKLCCFLSLHQKSEHTFISCSSA